MCLFVVYLSSVQLDIWQSCFQSQVNVKVHIASDSVAFWFIDATSISSFPVYLDTVQSNKGQNAPKINDLIKKI